MNVQDVHKLPFDLGKIFEIKSSADFLDLALRTFNYQYENNTIYRSYIQLIKKDVNQIKQLDEIPFLPIAFFKTHEVKTFTTPAPLIFESSGTMSQGKSKHHILDPTIYELSFLKTFQQFYGAITDYLVLALLPSYKEQEHSSLIYMVDHLICHSTEKESGFFLNDHVSLLETIDRNKDKKKILLIGVSYALLELAEEHGVDLSGCIVIETGGMKGKRRELTKLELHERLKSGLNVDAVHSEYGMTELLSQSYSKKDGIFYSPVWMKVLLRRYNDPFEIIKAGSGGINIIDLANVHSCSFIATQDLGEYTNNCGFRVLGRFDNSDLRGCNLLIK